jgi:hypothetical protein
MKTIQTISGWMSLISFLGWGIGIPVAMAVFSRGNMTALTVISCLIILSILAGGIWAILTDIISGREAKEYYNRFK